MCLLFYGNNGLFDQPNMISSPPHTLSEPTPVLVVNIPITDCVMCAMWPRVAEGFYVLLSGSNLPIHFILSVSSRFSRLAFLVWLLCGSRAEEKL